MAAMGGHAGGGLLDRGGDEARLRVRDSLQERRRIAAEDDHAVVGTERQLRAAVAVESRGGGAELGHAAEHEKTRFRRSPAAAIEGLRGVEQRSRAGIVAIDGEGARAVDVHAAATGRRRPGRERGGEFGGGAAGELRGDDGERGIAREAVGERAEREGLAIEHERASAVGGDAEGSADETRGRDRRQRLITEGHRDRAVRVGGEIRPGEQGRGQHGLAAGSEGADERSLLAGDAGERTDAFKVDGRDGGDDRDIGADDFRRDTEFAGQAHARLDHRVTVAGRVGAQQHQRDADGVVEVGFGREGFGAEQRGEELLGRGLADAAGDADHDAGESRAGAGRDAAQRGERIGDDELRERVGDGTADQGAGGARGAGGGEEIMAIATLGAHGDEHLSCAQGAGVDAETGDRSGGRGGPASVRAGGEVGRGVSGAHAETPLRSSRISRTT